MSTLTEAEHIALTAAVLWKLACLFWAPFAAASLVSLALHIFTRK